MPIYSNSADPSRQPKPVVKPVVSRSVVPKLTIKKDTAKKPAVKKPAAKPEKEKRITPTPEKEVIKEAGADAS